MGRRRGWPSRRPRSYRRPWGSAQDRAPSRQPPPNPIRCPPASAIIMENQKTTGRPVVLRTDRFRLVLDPQHGGIVRRWDLGDAGQVLPLFRPMADGATAPLDAACFPLVPWCNRIGEAAFVFEGRSYALRRNFPPEPHAIHGEGFGSTPGRSASRRPIRRLWSSNMPTRRRRAAAGPGPIGRCRP